MMARAPTMRTMGKGNTTPGGSDIGAGQFDAAVAQAFGDERHGVGESDQRQVHVGDNIRVLRLRTNDIMKTSGNRVSSRHCADTTHNEATRRR